MKLKYIAGIAFLVACQVQASTDNFEVDPVHTRVAFMVSHAGFSNAIGTFSGSNGVLKFDEQDWSQASITVTIPIASLNLGDDKWQKKILDGTFFDVTKYSSASFVSDRIEKLTDNSGIAHGVLTLHGISQPISLNFTLNALKRHPLTFKKTIGFSAAVTLSRKAFDMGAWGSLIGDDVKVLIELEATRSKSEKEPADALEK